MVKARMAKIPENVARVTLMMLTIEPSTFDLTRRSGYSSPGVSCARWRALGPRSATGEATLSRVEPQGRLVSRPLVATTLGVGGLARIEQAERDRKASEREPAAA
jgi:hypothetical protein